MVRGVGCGVHGSGFSPSLKPAQRYAPPLLDAVPQETSAAPKGGWEWKSAAHRDKSRDWNVSKQKLNLC